MCSGEKIDGYTLKGKVYGFSPFTKDIYPVAFLISNSFPISSPTAFFLNSPFLSNTSLISINARLSFAFIKFKSQIISLKSLYIGVADNNNKRKFSVDFTRFNKLSATSLPLLSPEIRILCISSIITNLPLNSFCRLMRCCLARSPLFLNSPKNAFFPFSLFGCFIPLGLPLSTFKI